MKKLLIKVICLMAFLIMSIGFFTACNNTQIKNTKPTPTMGVINITATEESRSPSKKYKKNITPTVAPSEIIIEYRVPTEPSTTITTFSTETVLNQEDNIEEETQKEEETVFTYPQTSSSCLYSPEDFQAMGVINWGDWSWTYYSEKILPGEDLYLPGRHVDENGYICDEEDYFCIASSSLPWGTIVETPFGKQGKVYDSGCASYILDVYVSW